MFFAIFISFSLLEGIITHLALRLDDELNMTPANHVNDRYGILVGKRDWGLHGQHTTVELMLSLR